MYRYLLLTLLTVSALATPSVPANAQGLSSSAAAVCQPSSYAFPNAIAKLPNGDAIVVKDVRRTISVLGRQAFRANCSITVVCVSADNSKPAFEAAKPNCKIVRDVIAATQTDDSAAKKLITTATKRPKDGYTPNSINLILK